MDGQKNQNEEKEPLEKSDRQADRETEEFRIKQEPADEEFTDLERLLAAQISEVLGEEGADGSGTEEEKPAPKKKNWFQKIPLWIRIPVLSLLGLVLALVLVINAMLDGIIVKFNGDLKEEEFDVDENDGREEVDPDSIVWENTDDVRQEEGVINILLVGEEAIGSGSSRGRTDSIMIVSVNFDQGAIKLTSLMRDMYVQIPGYQDNKLNSAYGSGGIPLLEETLELNLDIEIDGAVLVNFDGFENIIDSLGGVELSLTSDEAYYLNTTNYVSNPANRHLVAGTQTLNGNQALGYMRIRYVRTADNVADDFGRTARQRALLNAIFEKYKTKSLPDLLLIANELLKYVQTDISKTDIISYATSIVGMGLGELETLRIPQDNMYDPVYIGSMAVLVPHLPENVAALHEFIYGPEKKESGSEGENAGSDGEAGLTESQEDGSGTGSEEENEAVWNAETSGSTLTGVQ